MKKYLTLLPIALLALSGCNKPQQAQGLTILAPKGAPSIALYAFAQDQSLTTADAASVLPMFSSSAYDVIVAPTHGGLKAINIDHAPYKIAATITFGNLYLVKLNEADEEMSAGDNVLIFQQNNGMGKIFMDLYGGMGLNIYDATGGLDGDANSVKTTLASGQYTTLDGVINIDYVFAAEPVITAQGASGKVYKNIQTEFQNKYDGQMITQASIFVRNGANTALVDSFLAKVESDVNAALEDPALIKTAIESLGEVAEQKLRFGVPGAMAYNVTRNGNKLSLGFRKAIDIKGEIQNFSTILTSPTIGAVSEEIIYQ